MMNSALLPFKFSTHDSTGDGCSGTARENATPRVTWVLGFPVWSASKCQGVATYTDRYTGRSWWTYYQPATCKNCPRAHNLPKVPDNKTHGQRASRLRPNADASA